MTAAKIINSTDSVLLARAAIAWWEEQPQFRTCQELQIKEPKFIQDARRISGFARLRWHAIPKVTSHTEEK